MSQGKNDFLNRLIRLCDKVLGIAVEKVSDVLHLGAGKRKILLQFVKFALVGLSSAVVNYVAYLITISLLRPLHISWDYVVGNVMGFLLSVLWSYFLNSRVVFSEREKESVWMTLLKVYASYAFTGLLLNNALSWLWISVLKLSKMVAPLINILISTPINYIINKKWAYRDKT